MARKGKMRKPTAQELKYKHLNTGDAKDVIPAAVWGQLEPLDRVARDKTARWGNTLPSLVSPDLAGRFEAAYEALHAAVSAKDPVRVNKIATQLIKAWGVLEAEAEAAGHQPLPEHCYCVELEEGKIICIALHGWAELRQKYSDWTVYSFEDAARVLTSHFSEAFLDAAFDSFPNARVTRIEGVDKTKTAKILEDEIPW